MAHHNNILQTKNIKLLQHNTVLTSHTEIADLIACEIEMDLEMVRDRTENWIQPSANSYEKEKWWFLGGLPSNITTFIILRVGKGKCVEIWRRIHSVTMKLAKDIWAARCDMNKKRGWVFANLWKDYMDDITEEEGSTSSIDVTQHPEWFVN